MLGQNLKSPVSPDQDPDFNHLAVILGRHLSVENVTHVLAFYNKNNSGPAYCVPILHPSAGANASRN